MNHYVKELTQLFPRPLIHPSAPNNAMALSFLNSTKVRPLTHTSHTPHTHLTRPSHTPHTPLTHYTHLTADDSCVPILLTLSSPVR